MYDKNFYTNEHDHIIDSFNDDRYRFLSNFYDSPVHYNGFHYRNSESAYQANKFIDLEQEFVSKNPMNAKRKAWKKRDQIRPDWDDIKYDVMNDILWAKFTQSDDLKEKLIATGDREIIEGNYWGDTYWGMCEGVGENNLGKLLMQLRSELRQAN